MSKILLLTFLALTTFFTLFQPWIGITAYYFLGILGPQYIWFWSFEGLRSSLLVATVVQLSICIKFVFGDVDFTFLKHRHNLFIFGLLIFITLSYFFGAYASKQNEYYNTQELIIQTIKIFSMYFCAILAITDARKLRMFSLVVVAITIFFIGWANLQYFSGNWAQFNYGRLMGPNIGGAIYSDENAFGMFFVVGLPFCFFIGNLIDNRWISYAMLVVIPFGLHAIFLTGSRGAMLGLGASILAGIITSKQKRYALLFLPLFAVFFFWQGGQVMLDRTKMIVSYSGESSAESRLDAWIAGGKMILDHPLFGVGIGSFMSAMEDYSEIQPIIAHNTAIQYSAESGIGAGFCYIILALSVLKHLRNVNKFPTTNITDNSSKLLYQLSVPCTISFIGFLTCSMFLSLIYYEVYFFLLIICNSIITLHEKSQSLSTNLASGDGHQIKFKL